MIQLWDNIPTTANQQFMLTPTVSGRFIMQHGASGKCVSIIGNSTADGADMELRIYSAGDPAQEWTLVDAGNGSFRIRNAHSQKNLEVNGLNTANGTVIQQWSNAGENQIWRLQPQGDYAIRAPHSGKYISLQAAGTGNGTKVVQFNYANSNWFKWRFNSVGDGYFNVTSVHAPSSCISVQDDSTANSADCHLWSISGSNAMRIRLVPQTNGRLKFYFQHSGMTWDIPGGSTADNAILEQFPDGSGLWQQFNLERQ